MNAIFKRMNLLAEREATQVVLLNIQHGVNQKIAFANLRAQGVFHPDIRHQSLYEFCTAKDHQAPGPAELDLPDWETQKTRHGGKRTTSYYQDGCRVMRDTQEPTSAGDLLIREIVTDRDRDIRLKYLDDTIVESRVRFGDGVVIKSYFAHGQVACTLRQENRAFVWADSAVLGERFHNENNMHKAIVEQGFPPDCIVFVDGITTAYLSRHISARKVLVLHADHRAPSGDVVPRSRHLIENFEGDAILTATHVHKARLEKDLKHAAPIRVIPHYTDRPEPSDASRAHICTVSRLELTGKPIHQCIEAFTRIMHLIPDTNYLIYGSGLGQARLQQLIDHKGCGDRVFLKGYTTDPSQVFRKSLMSLAPTLTEGFGLSLLESLSCGCPVISYDVDYGPRELIRPGQNGELVAPGDIDGIVKAIRTVLDHRADYAKAARQTAHQYSFEVYQKNYDALLDDLTGRNFSFDIGARDLKWETRLAVSSAPRMYKARLLDLYIKLCADTRDLEGMYQGFQQKLDLFPSLQRPLMRCIWLSRKLGRDNECRAYLAVFAQRFPVNYRHFLGRYPIFQDIADALDPDARVR
ncbi:glycosyltransferase [Marivita sp. S0852]|uniref:glycosyltransferase n=1 Tax=Marivita sp. S0852 TaxID=3373893 RepID=UPI0039828DE8